MNLARGLALIAAILAGVALFRHGPSHHGKLDLGIWYWHSPFVVTDKDEAFLKSSGIETLYVRAGTFTTDGNRLRLMLPQVWRSRPKNLGVVVVFNFDPGLLGHFDRFSIPLMVDDISTHVATAVKEARSKGIEPKGIQFDIDCPARLLPKYAQFLANIHKRIRPLFGDRWSFSITALSSWLSSPAFKDVADQVDFVAPQFYESRIGMTIGNVKPISDPSALKAGLRRLDRLGVPFFVGLPAYGHAMIFDQSGHISAMYHGLSSEDALRHPALQYQSSLPIDEQGRRASEANYVGEDLLCIKAVRPDISGQGKGDSIAYLLPSAEMITREKGIVEQDAPQNCRGMILYRFPEPGETTCLSLQTIDAAIHHVPVKVDFDVDLHSRSVPFALIGDRRASEVPREVGLKFRSTGNAATLSAPRAFQALLQFDRPGIDDVEPGDFDTVEVGTLIGGKFVGCGRARATAVLLSRNNAQPGQDLRCAAIDLAADGPSTINVQWTAQGMGGFHVFSGSSPTRKLAELSR